MAHPLLDSSEISQIAVASRPRGSSWEGSLSPVRENSLSWHVKTTEFMFHGVSCGWVNSFHPDSGKE